MKKEWFDLLERISKEISEIISEIKSIYELIVKKLEGLVERIFKIFQAK